MRHVLRQCGELGGRHGTSAATCVASVPPRRRATEISAARGMLDAASEAGNPAVASPRGNRLKEARSGLRPETRQGALPHVR